MTESQKPEEQTESAKTQAPEKAEAPKAVKPASKAAKEKSGSKKAEGKKIFLGRRKESVSRVRMVKGTGEITVNGKTLDAYFGREVDRNKVKQPLVTVGVEKEYDIFVNVYGGGTTGQSEAIRLGISRSLQQHSPEFHKKLKDMGYLTRDSRMVERKKYGLHKARRASQFSKR